MSVQRVALQTDSSMVEDLCDIGDIGPLWNGLAFLWEAAQFAAEVNRDLWDFAVEAGTLRRAGLSKSAMRWLTCKGYVQHARDVTKREDAGRRFRPEGTLQFTGRSCFVLTDEGLRLLEQSWERSAGPDFARAPDLSCHSSPIYSGQGDGMANGLSARGPEAPGAVRRPSWDGQRHELRVGSHLVKAFKLPSRNQEAVLMALEEEGWPLRIDDPLPPLPNIHPKQRLHDTIKNLNRRQKRRMIRFMGDGTGQGVRWELISAGVTADT